MQFISKYKSQHLLVVNAFYQYLALLNGKPTIVGLGVAQHIVRGNTFGWFRCPVDSIA